MKRKNITPIFKKGCWTTDKVRQRSKKFFANKGKSGIIKGKRRRNKGETADDSIRKKQTDKNGVRDHRGSGAEGYILCFSIKFYRIYFCWNFVWTIPLLLCYTIHGDWVLSVWFGCGDYILTELNHFFYIFRSRIYCNSTTFSRYINKFALK